MRKRLSELYSINALKDLFLSLSVNRVKEDFQGKETLLAVLSEAPRVNGSET